MPNGRRLSQADPVTIAQLVRRVLETVRASSRQIEQAAVFADWETGRLINTHLLLNQGRAGHAEQMFHQLAQRTGISERTLYYCARFNRCFPVLNRGSNFTSRHYRFLCQIEDPEQRRALVSTAEKKNWTSDALAERVRRLNAAPSEIPPDPGPGDRKSGLPPPGLLAPKRGTPGLHPVVARREGLAIDLGFKIYLPLAALAIKPGQRIAQGDIITLAADGRIERAVRAAQADLYTYRALGVRVVDGDTLAVTIDLPPHLEIDKKLRLRGLDCPELNTAAGRAAKRFTQRLVQQARSITVTTFKPDKYDRYLAEVYLDGESATTAGASSSSHAPPLFLNNILLQQGHAVPSDGGAMPRWG
jgi:endonuclease YncB( thermonuclease family)